MKIVKAFCVKSECKAEIRRIQLTFAAEKGIKKIRKMPKEKGEVQMKRTLALLLAVALFCTFFVVAFGAEHDCAGENCQICCVLHTCLHLTLTLVLCVCTALVLPAFSFGMRFCSRAALRIGCISLITQKVKLSN